MNDIAAPLQALLDREAIRAALATLARGEDRRDGDLIKSAYWPDSVTDYGVFKGDFDAYYAWVIPGADAITNTQHVLGQSHIVLEGATAKVETQVISYHRVNMGEGEIDTCIGGRYLDLFEKRGDKWAIAARTMLYDWYQDWGAAIDWSTGLMGMPLPPEFSGWAVGDKSELFFGKRSG